MTKTTKKNRAADGRDKVAEIGANQEQPGVNAPFPKGRDPLFGQPEFIPQITFIATPLPNDNGYIGNARTFHENSGLSPFMVDSFDQIVDLLNDQNQTGSGIISRLRIVSHFFPDVSSADTELNTSNISLNMLNNSSRGVFKHQLEGWSKSNYGGLKSMIAIIANINNTIEFHAGAYVNSLSTILMQLPNADSNHIDAMIDVVDVKDKYKDFVRFTASKWLLGRHPNVVVEPLRTKLVTAYDLLLNELKPRIADTEITVNVLNSLESMIVSSQNFGQVNFVNLTNQNALVFRFTERNVSAGIESFNSDLFKRISRMRERFNKYSFVDIRGCDAGQETDYLRAIQGFFGGSETKRPNVTAPDETQRFNALAFQLVNSRNDLNRRYNRGVSVFDQTNFRQQFEEWASAFGITQQHMDFWHDVFQMHVLDFCKLTWRSRIPARLIIIRRLDDLVTAPFDQIFTQLADIFFFNAAHIPSNNVLSNLSPLRQHLNSWTETLDTAIPESATTSKLVEFHNIFKDIYDVVDNRLQNPAFNNRLIPSSPPSPIDIQTVQQFQSDLKEFINRNANSVFAPIKRFIDEGAVQTNDPPARFRYYLRLGLFVQLFHLTSPNFDHQLLVSYDDVRRNEAIRYWIRSLWRGTSPPSIPANVTWGNGRNGSWITENLNSGPSFVCPHEDHRNHISTLSADGSITMEFF